MFTKSNSLFSMFLCVLFRLFISSFVIHIISGSFVFIVH